MGKRRPARATAAALAVALLPGLAGCSTDGASNSPKAPSRRDRSDALLGAFAADEPGCSGAVARNDQVVWRGAVGMARLDPPVSMRTDTVFDIASTSKQFTATAVLLLADQGRLDLDATLGSVVPDLPAWADRPTIRQLVHHQSGVADYISLLDADDEDQTTVADALDVLREVGELDFEPGTAFEYSNSGYFLLSQVVEAVSGQTLAAYLEENVFRPLGLAAVMDPVPEIPRRATSYDPVEGASGFEVADSQWEQTGDGGIQTTPTELVRWASEYWEPTIGGEDLLRARTEDAVSDGEGSRYGAGIVVSDDDVGSEQEEEQEQEQEQEQEPEEGGLVLSHAGAWIGFVTDLVMIPSERLAAAVSCNSSDFDATELATELIEVWRA